MLVVVLRCELRTGFGLEVGEFEVFKEEGVG